MNNIFEKLEQHFGFKSFRNGQEEIITSILKGNNTLALLPTGTGKSLCYQLPGYILNGTVLIVSPLLSLMQDQVEQLHMRGEKRAVALNSFLSPVEKNRVLGSLEKYRFIYISPEMLASPFILERFKKLKISLFVIDEAHCISQWGYDFRTDYLRLGAVRKELNHPVTLALTATATQEVREDIIRLLDLEEMDEWILSVDRPNIGIMAENVPYYDAKADRLIEIVENLEKPGIVYFSSKRMAEEMADLLKKKGMGAAAYHGGMEQEQRLLIQQQFLYNQLEIICATSAFGMGINKENIRFVIHFHMPQQMESYLQEIGRAGRDGKQSIAIILYAPGDESLPINMIENELPSDWQIEEYCLAPDKEPDLNLTEIQERFLHFYSNSLSDVPDQKIKYIKEIRDKRIHYKFNKLKEVKQWLHSRSCRRKGILAYFKEEQIEVNDKCCDICGLQMDDYKKTDVKITEESQESWEKTLTSLLLRK